MAPFAAIIGSQIDADQNAKYDAWNPPALRRLIAGGAQLRGWSREVLQAAWREANGVYEELASRNPNFRKMWENCRRFRDDQSRWFRMAENGYQSVAFSADAQQARTLSGLAPAWAHVM